MDRDRYKRFNKYLINPLIKKELEKYENGSIFYQVTHENRYRIYLKYINSTSISPMIYCMSRQMGRTYFSYRNFLYNRRIFDAKI